MVTKQCSLQVKQAQEKANAYEKVGFGFISKFGKQQTSIDEKMEACYDFVEKFGNVKISGGIHWKTILRRRLWTTRNRQKMR